MEQNPPKQANIPNKKQPKKVKMMNLVSRVLAATAATSTLLLAQIPIAVPQGSETSDANSASTYPWKVRTNALRVQYIYDAGHFTASNAPILIHSLRWRANSTGTSWTGGTYANVKIDLSSASTDWTTASSVFAQNHGTDRKTVFEGSVTIKPGAGQTSQPGPWYVEIKLDRPFYFDPSLADDFAVDIRIDGQWTSNGGTGSTSVDSVSGISSMANASRVHAYGDHLATVGGKPAINNAVVMEVGYQSAVGVVPIFSAKPTIGSSPLTVQFGDHSFSDHDSGIIARAWDFNGDGIYESGLVNPSFTYLGGQWDVTLVVTDASNVPYMLTKLSLIEVDVPVADFDADSPVAAIGQPVQFADMSSNGPTTWAWDLNGDGQIDSTDQSPAHRFRSAGTYDVTLTVTNNNGADTVTKKHFVEVGILPMPEHKYIRSDTWRTHGFHFTAPVAFSITSLEVPMDAGTGLQNVTIVRAANGTAQQGTTLLEITGAAPGAQIPCSVSFAKGDEVLVFGAIGDASLLHTSLGDAQGMSLFGYPVKLSQATYNQNMVKVPISTQQATFYLGSGSTIGRLKIAISTAIAQDYGTGTASGSSQNIPTLTTLALPRIGMIGKLEFTQSDVGSHAAVILLGLGQNNLPTPFGTLLVDGIIGDLPLPSMLGTSPATVSMTIPDSPALATSGPITFQGVILRPSTANGLSLTNGTEWQIGY